jgi:hypothetical protein
LQLQLVFENTGSSAWPKVELSRVHGDLDLVASPKPYQGGFVQPGQSAIFLVDFKAPSKPGIYLASFRLAHGDNKIEFGEKASIDIHVQTYPKVEASVEVPVLSFDNVANKPAEVPSEKVEEPKPSDKEIAMMRSQQMLDKFEKDDQMEKSFEIEADAVSVESNEIDIIDEPVVQADIMDDPVIQEEPSQKILVNPFQEDP